MSYEVIRHSTDESDRPIVNVQGVVLDHENTVKLSNELNCLLAAAARRLRPDAEKNIVTLRDVIAKLISNAGDSQFVDTPLSILVEDGNRNCEWIHLANLGWHHLPRRDGQIAINVSLSEHRLVKKRKEGGK